MHRDTIPEQYLGMLGRETTSKRFVAELRDEGVSLKDSAKAVHILFGVPRPAAILFVRSHPAWVDLN